MHNGPQVVCLSPQNTNQDTSHFSNTNERCPPYGFLSRISKVILVFICSVEGISRLTLKPVL